MIFPLVLIGALCLFCSDPDKDGRIRGFLRFVGLCVCGLTLMAYILMTMVGLLFG
jgi:hypothetical protein